MARKTKNRAAPLARQRSVSIKEAHVALLALIAPDSHSLGIRFLMQWAINSGALASFLNLDGTAPNPPHSAKQLEALRLASLKAAIERNQAPAPRPVSIVPPTTLDANGIPDDYDGDDWSDLIKPAPQPAQPTAQAVTAGYKPATDADMRAMMQDIERSLK